MGGLVRFRASAMTVVAAVAVVVAVSGGPAAASSSSFGSPQAPVYFSQKLVAGPWENHELGFKTKAHCERRRVHFDRAYKQKVVGGVAYSRCSSYPLPSCGGSTKLWMLQARTWFASDGARPTSVGPSATVTDLPPAATVLAC